MNKIILLIVLNVILATFLATMCVIGPSKKMVYSENTGNCYEVVGGTAIEVGRSFCHD